MNNELLFSTVSVRVIDIYRAGRRIAYIYRPLGSREWHLRHAGSEAIAIGTPAAMRRLAVEMFCECEACCMEKLSA